MRQSDKRSLISGYPSNSSTTPAGTTAYESYESRSPVQRRALALTRLYAANNRATIVFEGESGTGKTLIASYAHSISRRASNPFKWLSLAAIDESLAPSELFGHVKGAFTDARKDRAGAIASASHGTLFLDEIGKASPSIQQLLLRAVEAKTICPVGADRDASFDVRFMVATNIPLSVLCKERGFLPDLAARFGVLRVVLPPLRERRQDIPALAQLYVRKHAAADSSRKNVPSIHPELMTRLQDAKWPLNLRELDSVMEALLIHSQGASMLEPDHCFGVLDYLRSRKRGRPRKSSANVISAEVAKLKSKSKAADSLGVSRATVDRYLKQIHLSVGDSKHPAHKSKVAD